MGPTNSPFVSKFVPSTEELSQVQRDLRFHPATGANPQTLKRDEIVCFNRDGYLKGIRIFSDDEIMETRRYFDDLLAKTLASGRDSYSISTAHCSTAASTIC